MDQLPRLGKRELICLLLFTCNYVVSVWRGFLFLWVLGMGYIILLWHSLSLLFITKTSPCNEDPPYTPLLYSKTGVYRGIHYFLILLQNIDCGYSLELPHGSSNEYPQSMFWSKNKKNIRIFHLKIIVFTAVKYCCILHGHVGVMNYFTAVKNCSILCTDFCKLKSSLRLIKFKVFIPNKKCHIHATNLHSQLNELSIHFIAKCHENKLRTGNC